MKKVLAITLAAVMLLATLVACGGNNTATNNTANGTTNSTNNTTDDTNGDTATTTVSGTVNTNGSTSMEDVMGSLKEAFEAENPDVTIQYTGSGSGAGITGAQEGTCDIGLASRDLKEDETGVHQITVAKDGIAIIVNPENPVSDLTIEQIAALATGEIANWADVDGNDAEVVFMGREAGSGTRDGFESITGTEVAGVAANPNAIGYASLSAVEGDTTVKVLTVGGVAPSEATVLDGTYEIQRNFNFIISDSTELSPAAQAFVDWATSTAASDLIAGAGAVPVAE